MVVHEWAKIDGRFPIFRLMMADIELGATAFLPFE